MRIKLNESTWGHIAKLKAVFPYGDFYFSTDLGDEIVTDGTRKGTEAEILRRWPGTTKCEITYLEVAG